MLTYKCEGDDFEQIPDDILKQTGIGFPEAHQDGRCMAILAKALKHHRHDTFCRVPFCVTVEAEAMGGKIKLGDAQFGPRVASYAFEVLSDFLDSPEPDFTQGRAAEVLASIGQLYADGETVVLNVEGPFTILSALMDPKLFYKALKSDRRAADAVIQRLEDCVFDYVMAGVQKGARVISYGDPTGSMDLVGPKIYREVGGPVTCRLLKRMEQGISEKGLDVVIHLCGKTSVSLEHAGLSQRTALDVGAGLLYGEAIQAQLKMGKGVSYIGNACIKRTPMKVINKQIWSMKWL